MIFKPLNGTPEQRAKLKKCSDIINDVIHTDEFKNKVDKDIVQKLHEYESAHVKFFIKGDAVGTAYPPLNRIGLKISSFEKRPLAKTCNTIMHEWLHL